MTWKTFNWEALCQEVDAETAYLDELNDQMVKGIYLGRIWSIMEDHHNHDEYEEMEEAVPDGYWLEAGEGDPTDIYLMTSEN